VLIAGPFDVTYDLFVASHFFILAAGTYGLAISLDARAPEAFLAAAIASLSGPIISLESLLNVAQGLAYAPWVYWGVLSMLRAPTRVNLGALALALGFHAQGLMPELLVLDAVAVGVLVLALRPKITLRHVAFALGAVLLASAMASITLAPGLELLSASRRGSGFTLEERTRWSLSIGQAVDVLAPSFWAPPDRPFLNVPRFTGTVGGPWLLSLYLGTATALVGVAVSFLRTKERLHRSVLIALVASCGLFLLLALGANTPLYGWISSLPLLSSSRYPVKYVIPAFACASVLAPIALRLLQIAPRRFVYVQAGLTLAAVCLYVGVSSSSFARFLQRALAGDPAVPPFVSLSTRDFATVALESMKARALHGLSACLIMFMIAAAYLRSREGPRLSWLVAAAVGADLAIAATYVIFGAPIRRAPEWAVERVLSPHHRVFDLAPGGLLPAVEMHGGTFFENMIVADRQRRLVLDPRVRRYDDPDPQALSNPIHSFAFEQVGHSNLPRGLLLLARAGVAFIESSGKELPLPHAFAYHVPGGPPEHVYEVPGVRPYVSAYTRWRPVRFGDLSTEDFVRHATEKDSWFEALVFEDVPAPTSTTCASSAKLRDSSSIEVIDVDVDATCPALVVALEPRMPGWSATVDGAPAQVLDAELGFIGTFAGAGRHRVHFEYVPRIDRYGPIALVAFLVALALASSGAWGRRTS
jgi:hypothetical protein